MSAYELDVLWKACIRFEPPRARPSNSPACIFQILSNKRGEVLFSWPPPRLYRSTIEAVEHKAHPSSTYVDGSYFADDFARLVQGVHLPPRPTADESAAADQPETSCTRRFHATHTFVSNGISHAVESVVIPYGQLMFACFRVVSETSSPASSAVVAAAAATAATAAAAAAPSPAPGPAPASAPEVVSPAAPALALGGNPQAGATTPSDSHGWGTHAPPPPHHLVHATTQPPPHPPPSQPAPHQANGTYDGMGSLSPTGVPSASSDPWPSVIASRPQTATPVDPPSLPPGTCSEWDATLPSDDKRRKRPTSTHEDAQRRRRLRTADPEKACASCGIRNSPEWRKGPGGRKSLCNACGLRFGRQIQRQQKLLEAALEAGGEDALHQAAAALGSTEGAQEATEAVLKKAKQSGIVRTHSSPKLTPAPLGPGPTHHPSYSSHLSSHPFRFSHPGPGALPPGPAPGPTPETSSPASTAFNRGVSNASTDTYVSGGAH